MLYYPHQTQNESVQSDYVIFPDHVIEYFDALVELLSASGGRELVDKKICKRAHMSHQRTSPDTVQDPVGKKVRLQLVLHPTAMQNLVKEASPSLQHAFTQWFLTY